MKGKNNPNLVYNPDFAEGLSGWSIDAAPGVVQPATFAGRTAARCEKRASAFIGQDAYQPLSAGTYVFEYSAAIEGNEPSSSSHIVVTARYLDGSFVSRRTEPFFPGHDWETSGLYHIMLEREAQSLIVGIYANWSGGVVDGYVYFTGISVRKTF